MSDQRLLEIAEHTRRDTTLGQLIHIIKEGWPNDKTNIPCGLRPYFHIRNELATENDIIFRGDRCLIPVSLRDAMLEKIHSTHLGITSSIRRARESVYWPGMSGDIKNYIADCHIWNTLRSTAQPKESLQQHDRPPSPWAKVGIDLFSANIKGLRHDFVITVDYWSNCF